MHFGFCLGARIVLIVISSWWLKHSPLKNASLSFISSNFSLEFCSVWHCYNHPICPCLLLTVSFSSFLYLFVSKMCLLKMDLFFLFSLKSYLLIGLFNHWSATLLLVQWPYVCHSTCRRPGVSHNFCSCSSFSAFFFNIREYLLIKHLHFFSNFKYICVYTHRGRAN